MNAYIQGQYGDSKVFQEFAAPDDIFPYSIDEGFFIDLTSSLNYFIPDPSLSKGKTGSPFCQNQKGSGRKLESTLPSASATPIPFLPSWPWTMKPSIAEICAPTGLMKM